MGARASIGRGFVALVLTAGSVLLSAQPAAAANSVSGTAQLGGLASSITRGTPDAATVTVSATQGATFDLDVTGPGVTTTFSSCSLSPGWSGGSPTSKCAVTAAGVVTVGIKAGEADAQTVTVNISVGATSITSTEGQVGGTVTVTASGAATGTTTGGTLTSSTANTDLLPSATNDAAVNVVTATPSPDTIERGPTAKTTYSATFQRSGKTNAGQGNTTAVDVQLLAVNSAQGTTVSNPTVTKVPGGTQTLAACAANAGPDCTRITFGSGDASTVAFIVTFDVSVPATADVGTTTYAFRATYDPNGTDGSPLDVEKGDQKPFTVLTDTPPDTTLDSVPVGGGSTAEFGFSSPDDAGATFECELTGPDQSAGFTACTSPKEYTGLNDGDYTFSVRAKDDVGNVDASPATQPFTVDTTPPITTIDSGPGDTSDNIADFTFSSEAGATFECKFDGPGATLGSFAACTSPQSFPGLAEGDYTFSVQAKDTFGNAESPPITKEFTVDNTAPETTIDSGPGTTSDAIADFAYSSSEPSGATFECKLDGPGATTGTYTACNISPTQYTGLADGSYTFYVRATDADGNQDQTPDSQAFSVLFVPPTTTLCNGRAATMAGTDGADTIVGTPDADVIVGLGGNDIIEGLGGNDVICGGTGDDKIYGEDGNDSLIGDAGNDFFTGGYGADRFAGGDGTYDRVSYTDPQHTTSVLVTIGNGKSDDGSYVDGTSTARDQVYSDVEGVIGGPGNDKLIGTAAANSLDGAGGDDTLQGLAGNDTLVGGSSGDYLYGGYGRDSVIGGTGVDAIYGEGDGDYLYAQDNTKDARIDGGAGTDVAYRDSIDPAPISVP